MQADMAPKKQLIWKNIIFFASTTLFALIGCPLYFIHYGLSTPEIILFTFYMAATGMGITVGYHRLYSHASYKAHPIVRFLLLFFGAAAFEQSCLDWSSQHRYHHRFVDTDQDPYSIKKGFFYAHMGWLIFWKHPRNYDNVKDLQSDPMVMHQKKYYGLWALTSSILLPVAIGAMFGHALGAFLFAFCLRLTLVYHATFCINSVCHMFGKATYDIYSSAKDHWLVALITYGEGYHNFHHRFPSDYRNAVRWYQWDPSKWMIRGLSFLGLTQDLKRVSRFRILEARLAGETQRASDRLAKLERSFHPEKAMDMLRLKQQQLRTALAGWEAAAKDYQALMMDRVRHQSEDLKKIGLQKIQEARVQFSKMERSWSAMMSMEPTQLQKNLLDSVA